MDGLSFFGHFNEDFYYAFSSVLMIVYFVYVFIMFFYRTVKRAITGFRIWGSVRKMRIYNVIILSQVL